MGIWKITDQGPISIEETKMKKENLLEEHLETWIEKDPLLLGEPLLIIGRQVIIPEIKDRLDLLAIDVQGRAVIIELKIGKLKDPVDMQALRYASYISKWEYEDFENQARNYKNKVGDPDFNFIALFESFCEDAGVDEIPDMNNEQRVIIVGSSVRDKLGSVALWLYDHGIDIKVIEVQSYKDKDTGSLLIEPSVVIPLQVSKFEKTGVMKADGSSPWIKDGKTWHLEKRCSPKTKAMFDSLEKIILDNFEVEGPSWNQKHYVAYRISNYNWLSVITAPNFLRLDFLLKAGAFNSEDVAKQLNIVKFDKEESLSEKMNLPSSIYIKNRNENTDRLYMRTKDDFDFTSTEFLNFMKAAYKAFPK